MKEQNSLTIDIVILLAMLIIIGIYAYQKTHEANTLSPSNTYCVEYANEDEPIYREQLAFRCFNPYTSKIYCEWEAGPTLKFFALGNHSNILSEHNCSKYVLTYDVK